MDSTAANVELVILRELSTSGAPKGAWAVHEWCHCHGVKVSLATVGRLLKHLDIEGFTRPVSNTGREITDLGRRHLAKLERDLTDQRLGHELISATYVNNIQELMELLRARRAVECESAYLAALRATTDQIQELERLSHDDVDLDLSFHRTIAESSGNRFLAATAMLLFKVNQRLEQWLSTVSISRKRYGVFRREHEAIWRAIRDRRPDYARTLMGRHIDTMHGEIGRQLPISATPGPSPLDNLWEPEKPIR